MSEDEEEYDPYCPCCDWYYEDDDEENIPKGVIPMKKSALAVLLTTGDVVELPVGMTVWHNQGDEVLTLQNPAIVVVESTREVLPFKQTGVEAHFELTGMIKARALNERGEYTREGALLTFAQYGDFRPEFILPDKPNIVLRKMRMTFLPVEPV